MKETTIKLVMDQFLAMPKEHIAATHILCKNTVRRKYMLCPAKV